ncbi:MAG: hypothetical protein LZF60_340159 [Nitrospira sp.]|nr:MAG: hypothetical protein LZF60_340159 [Nitrospira sp.]
MSKEQSINQQGTLRQVEPCEYEVHRNLGFDLLTKGHFLEGFQELEHRLQCPSYLASEGIPVLPVPRWDGQRLDGKTILLWAEQGYGDNIQFIRYAPMVAERGGSVIVACPPALQRLFGTVRGISKVYKSAEEFSGASYEYQAPILSLPYLFGTTIETIPADAYLLAPTESAVCLRPSKGLKVGLVWAGNPQHANDARRSVALAYLLPLLQEPGVSWYSLQVGLAAREIIQLGLARLIQDLSPQLHDFADTADAIRRLDLVITVDTAVAHLAGAMGKPVWVMLPAGADWRWLENRTDSPWYPTARLFRQPWQGNWVSVVKAVGLELTDLQMRKGQQVTSTLAEALCALDCLDAPETDRLHTVS